MLSHLAKLLNKSNRSPCLRTAIIVLLGRSGPFASDIPAYTSSDIFELVSRPHVGVTLFSIGYGNEKYGSTQGGFQLEQSVNRLFGLVARASAYQIFKGTNRVRQSPFALFQERDAQFCTLFQGRVDVTPF